MKSGLIFLFMLSLSVVLVLGEEDCPHVCPFLYSPVCAQEEGGAPKNFNNECEFKKKNCEEKTKFALMKEGPC